MAEADAVQQERFTAGEYTLLSDLFRDPRSGVEYRKGDAVPLGKADAARLGNAGSIAAPDSEKAAAARGDTSVLRQRRIAELEQELARLKGEDETSE